MDYFLFNFSGVQFHYTMSHIFVVVQRQVFHRKGQAVGLNAAYNEDNCRGQQNREGDVSQAEKQQRRSNC